MTRKLLEHLNHELRSPMTVVVGMTELLMLSPLPAEQRAYLDSVKQASDGLLLMLDELIDFSRLESGTFELSHAAFAVADVLADAQRRVGRMMSSVAQLKVDVDGPMPKRLTGDGERLGQMIAALVRSAAKLRSARAYRLRVAAAPAGERHATLHFALGLADGDFTAIADEEPANGEWLTMQSIERTGYRGAGLGLPMTAGLAALMQGRLWTACDVKHPVVFRLTCQAEIPSDEPAPLGDDLLKAVEDRLAPQPAKASGPLQSMKASGPLQSMKASGPLQSMKASGPLRVLLAEDTRANQEFFRSVLERAGHQVVAVSDGQHALRELASAEPPFDVALVDLQMPLMNGHELAGQFRQSESYAARPVPLVALTADRVAGDARLLASGHFDAAITKPCDLSHLLTVIDAVVRGESPPLSSAQPTEPATPERLVDYRGAISRLGGDESLFRELIGFFLDDAPPALERLRAALHGRDAGMVEREAHCLKGLAANFGAPGAVAAATELQRLGHSGNLADADPHVRRLESQVADLVRELTAYIA